MSSLKAAVIGCGGHAQLHLRMIDKEPRLHLVGVAEIDATRREQAQAEWRVEGFADYRRMLDACKPDLVVVATMPGHLKAIVIDCLERGVHTSVEKAPRYARRRDPGNGGGGEECGQGYRLFQSPLFSRGAGAAADGRGARRRGALRRDL